MKVTLVWLALSLPAVLAVQSQVSRAKTSSVNDATGVSEASSSLSASQEMDMGNATHAMYVIDKVVFIKLHNVGSSTMTGILHRYCEFHQKNCFVHPLGSRPGQTLEHEDLAHILSALQSADLPVLDIFPSHEVMDTSLLNALVPGNFIFSLFRTPLDRIMSSLRHHDNAETVLWTMEQLKQNITADYSCGMANGRMSMQIATEQVDELDFVMLTEEYDTSLMMLRRALGWSMFDMVYRRLKDHRDKEGVYNATRSFQEYLSAPAASKNEATKAYLETCIGPTETSVHLRAKMKFQQQLEKLSEAELQDVMADTAKFQSVLALLEECCGSSPNDSYCEGLMEDNKEWTSRYWEQGYSYTSMKVNGETIESPVTQESVCMSRVKAAIGGV